MTDPAASSAWDGFAAASRAVPDPSAASPLVAPVPTADGPKLYSVSEISRAIRQRLDALGRIAVEGEVSRIVRAASGHLYFDLKDFEAKLACTVWRSQVTAGVRFELREGMQVVAHGRLDVYAPRGTYSLIVQRLEQRGIGALLVELERVKAELRARGWFERRRALPKLPRTIGVVTSRDGAAFQDFLRTRSLRWPLYPVRLAHTPVQGVGAAREIAAAIARLDKSGVDVIVLCRGGGSIEDLWPFNELAVAEAIWSSSVPVVSGVGHETDVTLADFVADHRAHTPTDAAQTVIPDKAALEDRIAQQGNWLGAAIDAILCARAERFERAARSRCLRDAGWILGDRFAALERSQRSMRLAVVARCARAAAELDQGALRLARSNPLVRIEQGAARLSNLTPRLDAAIARSLAERERRLALSGTALSSISPESVLARGYSITRRRGAGEPLRSVADLCAGEQVETQLAQGTFLSRIEHLEDGDVQASA